MSERQVNFKLGELDLVLVRALTYTDLKQMQRMREPGFAEKDPWGAVDLVIEMLWKCAHAGDPSVTRKMIEDNFFLPDGMETVMVALLQVVGTPSGSWVV
jgi:hypothetical protein